MTASRVPNFDPVARPYRWLEYATFGRALERCRNHFLARLLDRRQALVLGDGDGRFLAALLASNPHLESDAVDTSASMLHLLKHRSAAGTRLRTHQTSALVFIPHRTYDLIATHFFLDCLTQPELERLCTRLAPHLTPDGLWLVSDFRIPTGAMRWPALALVRALYLGFRLLTGLRTTTLPDHTAALTSAGLTRVAIHRSLAGLLTTELWQPREYTASMLPPQRPKSRAVDDPVPDPEPASPSLTEPDPGVFHHEPGDPSPPPPKSTKRSLIGPISLVLACLALTAFLGVAIVGLAKGAAYPHFPAWFAETANASFWASLSLVGISLVGLMIDSRKKPYVAALLVSMLTTCLVAWYTTAD